MKWYAALTIALVAAIFVGVAVYVAVPWYQTVKTPLVLPPLPPIRSSSVILSSKPLAETLTISQTRVAFAREGFTLGPATLRDEWIYFMAASDNKAYLIRFSIKTGTSDVPIPIGEAPLDMSVSLSPDGELVFLTTGGKAFLSRIGDPVLLGTPNARKFVKNGCVGSNDGVASIDVYGRDGERTSVVGFAWRSPGITFGSVFDLADTVAVVSDDHQVFVFRFSGVIWTLESTIPLAGVKWIFILKAGGFFCVTSDTHYLYADNAQEVSRFEYTSPVLCAAASVQGTLAVADGRKIYVTRGGSKVSSDVAMTAGGGLWFRGDDTLFLVTDTKGVEINV
jgi:hypothetical protein